MHAHRKLEIYLINFRNFEKFLKIILSNFRNFEIEIF